jgi:hypothetical protein
MIPVRRDCTGIYETYATWAEWTFEDPRSPSESDDRVHDSRYAWDLTRDRLSRADLQARSHDTIQIHNMIHRLHADSIWLDKGASSELQLYIRGDLCITRTAAKPAFLICGVERTSRKSVGQDENASPRIKCTSGAAAGRYNAHDFLDVPTG